MQKYIFNNRGMELIHFTLTSFTPLGSPCKRVYQSLFLTSALLGCLGFLSASLKQMILFHSSGKNMFLNFDLR